MPGPITHLKAAYIFGSKYNDINLPQLLLGAVCPDSVNVNGHADKVLRWPAHLRNRDLDAWLQNAKQFYYDNINKYENSYLKGYILHIVTDIVWDKYFEAVLCAVMHKKGISPQNFKETRWSELYGYEQQQVEQDWFKLYALPLLTISTPSDIGTLTAKNIQAFKEKILALDLEKGRTPQLLNNLFMDEFFEKVVEEAEKIIKI